MEWIDRNKISTNLGTKNLDAASDKKHTMKQCNNDNKFQQFQSEGGY